MNCFLAVVIGIVAAFIALTEARNARPRIQVYEIRQEAQDEDTSPELELAQPKYNLGGQSSLKKRISASRGKQGGSRDETLRLLKELLVTLQEQQRDYSELAKSQSDYDEEAPKRSAAFAKRFLRDGNSRVSARPGLRTGAPIHRYVYRDAKLRAAPETSSSSD